MFYQHVSDLTGIDKLHITSHLALNNCFDISLARNMAFIRLLLSYLAFSNSLEIFHLGVRLDVERNREDSCPLCKDGQRSAKHFERHSQPRYKHYQIAQAGKDVRCQGTKTLPNVITKGMIALPELHWTVDGVWKNQSLDS
jgi:uncharacterized Zn-finger protein